LAVCTATDGNHGRSVAWGAQQLGIECHIFIHAGVSQNRADSMTELGATVHRVEGNYDFSIAECIRLSEQHGWQIVSDTSWEGYRDIPNQVMAGYTVLADEIVAQLDGEIPTHIFLQAGCGGMAGALMGYFWQQWREELPSIVIVESDMSDCVYQSVKQQSIVLVDIVEETLMAGLSCGEVSELAWPLIQRGASHIITLNDDGVAPMMQWLAKPTADRPVIEGGECSASGLIGLVSASQDESLKSQLVLDSSSSILVIGTEGATDAEQYQKLIRA
jgi:diaminopropionate ammonia-lyase